MAISGGAAGQPVASDDARAIAVQAVADTESRSSLLGDRGGGKAGRDARFFIAGDGFRLNIGGQVQMRYLADFREDESLPTPDADDVSAGFQLRRVRFNFNGTLDKDWSYQVMADFGRAGEFTLFDAYIDRALTDGLRLRLGQFKAPVQREDIILQNRQLAVERSISSDALRPDRFKAAGLYYTAAHWRAVGTLNSGANTRNTDFDDANNADLGVSGRIEFSTAADWKRWDDFTSPRGDEFALLAGAGVLYQIPHNTPAVTDIDRTQTIASADLSFEGDGWNAHAAVTWRSLELRSAAGESTTDDFGFVAQGGVLVSNSVELFARWDALLLDDDDRTIDSDLFQFITAGVNWYLAGHALKVTGDVVYSVVDTEDLVDLRVLPSRGQGLLGQSEAGEVLVRLQVQLMF